MKMSDPVWWNASTEMDSTAPAYRLVRRPVPAPRRRPSWTTPSSAVVSHAGGPLLVLAGPGTGKTTAIVEAVVHRISRARHRPGAGARAHLQPQGRRGTAGADHDAAGPDHPAAARADLPQLRLRPGAPGVRAGRGRAAGRCCPARSSCSRSGGCCAARPRTAAGTGPSGSARRWHPGLRRRAAGLPAPRGRAGPGRARAGPAGPAARPGRLGRGGRLPGRGTPPGSTSPRCPPTTTPRSSGSPPGCSAAGRDQGPGAPGLRRRAASTSTRTPTRRRRSCCTRWPATAGS